MTSSLENQFQADREEFKLALLLLDEIGDSIQALVSAQRSHTMQLEYAMRGGHRTRPLGCLLATSAVGGDWRRSLDVGLAIELIHKCSVLKDDVADGDKVRTGRDSFHVRFGLDEAVATSDVLLTLAFERVGSVMPSELAGQLLKRFIETTAEMARGQLEDVSPSLNCHSVQARLAVAESKTGSLAGLACASGAAVGGGTQAEIAALDEYGRKMGTAFQVMNDVRNLEGAEPGRLPQSDIQLRRENVVTAQISESLALEVGRPLDSLHLESSTSESQNRSAAGVAEAASFGRDLAGRLLNEARSALACLPPSPAAATLRALAEDRFLQAAF